MSETTPAELEQRTRELADEYMARNPGVARQRAKAIVRPTATVQLNLETFGKQWRKAVRVANRSVEAMKKRLREEA